MDKGVSTPCQIDVRSRASSGTALLDDAVLGARRIGRVERCAEGVTVGLSEADPALVQPSLPLLLLQALRLGVGKHKRLQLFPSERLDLRVRLGDTWQRRRLLSLRGAAEPFAEQQLDRGNPGPDVGDRNLDSLAVATVGALELDPGRLRRCRRGLQQRAANLVDVLGGSLGQPPDGRSTGLWNAERSRRGLRC
jgi:hypothetical protein